MNTVVALFSLNLMLVLTSTVALTFAGDATSVGAVHALNAVGAIAGGMLAAVPLTVSVRSLVGACAALGAALLLNAAAPSLPALLLLGPVLGVGVGFYHGVLNAAAQASVPPAQLGRTMSLVTLGNYGVAPIGAVLMGAVIDASSGRVALLIGGCAALASAIFVWARTRGGGSDSGAGESDGARRLSIGDRLPLGIDVSEVAAGEYFRSLGEHVRERVPGMGRPERGRESRLALHEICGAGLEGFPAGFGQPHQPHPSVGGVFGLLDQTRSQQLFRDDVCRLRTDERASRDLGIGEWRSLPEHLQNEELGQSDALRQGGVLGGTVESSSEAVGRVIQAVRCRDATRVSITSIHICNPTGGLEWGEGCCPLPARLLHLIASVDDSLDETTPLDVGPL